MDSIYTGIIIVLLGLLGKIKKDLEHSIKKDYIH